MPTRRAALRRALRRTVSQRRIPENVTTYVRLWFRTTAALAVRWVRRLVPWLRSDPAPLRAPVGAPLGGPVGGRPSPFPVDVVYTWVDESDPEWRRALDAALAGTGGGALHPEAANRSRFSSRDELRYSLRSLEAHAGFVRRVFLVTAGHVPEWLATSSPDLTVVRHDEILDPAWLPTFNSHAIEARLHRIPELAEHFLYVNDDVFFGREVSATTFFTDEGLPRFLPDETAPIPPGSASAADSPVDAAAKNVRDLLRRELGAEAATKMRHGAHPLRRSLLVELEERFAGEFKRTGSHRFRDPTDVSVASCLAHHFAAATDRAAPAADGNADDDDADVAVEYVNIAWPRARLQMRRLLVDRDRDVFCLNETDLEPRHRTRVDRAVVRFLRAYFPDPSRFEATTPAP